MAGAALAPQSGERKPTGGRVKATLGTQLRHLIELLDGAVGASYDEAGLVYRPRYTPLVRALMVHQPATIGQLASAAGISQPAATQTIALMLKDGLITATPAPQDGRQKLIQLSAQGTAMLPALQLCWQATAAAARSLDAELAMPLSVLLEDALAALQARSYGARIRSARAALQQGVAPLQDAATR